MKQPVQYIEHDFAFRKKKKRKNFLHSLEYHTSLYQRQHIIFDSLATTFTWNAKSIDDSLTIDISCKKKKYSKFESKTWFFFKSNQTKSQFFFFFLSFYIPLSLAQKIKRMEKYETVVTSMWYGNVIKFHLHIILFEK